MPVRRSFTEIKTDGKTRLKNATPVNNFTETSIAGAFLDIIASESTAVYDAIDYIHRALDPTQNYGTELDNIGYLVGQRRNQATLAIDDSDTNFYFYIDRRQNAGPLQLLNLVYPLNTHFNIRQRLVSEGFIDDATNPTYIKIPRGTVVYNNDRSISFTTTRDAMMTQDKPNAYTGVIANVEGSASNVESNVIVKHNLDSYTTFQYLAKYILCANNFPVSNGTNTMTDKEYRYNITLKPMNYLNNEVAIRQAALNIPGVRNILFERSKYGYGTYGIIVEGTSPLISDGLINTVQERLQSISGGDTVFVKKPDYKGVELSFEIITELGADQNTTVASVRDRVINYIINLPIGDTIIWNEIVSIIMDTDGVKDFITDYFKIGEYDPYSKLNKKQIVLRPINQRSYSTEKFYTDKGLIKICSRQG